MIKAYNEYYLEKVQDSLANMFELAVLYENVEINEFAARFTQSPVCRGFEIADPIWVLGKSPNELAGIILERDIVPVEQSVSASPEYWTGWSYAYAQWALNTKYRELFQAFPPEKLIQYYFPYHEMDAEHTLGLIKRFVSIESKLKEKRLACGYTQQYLAVISGVNLRSIRAYEQGSLDIANASGETLYALSKALHCKIEDLLK